MYARRLPLIVKNQEASPCTSPPQDHHGRRHCLCLASAKATLLAEARAIKTLTDTVLAIKGKVSKKSRPSL